ncbi:hypothetical protein [Alteromonas halophila]|uniref:Uncharacterized protein n=1 Tax=Alteromonas halophila TaxID=516698 RepID=A0A918JS21_9ALTE|nr:hypothetical protein [Alteromonas halophila]GGW96892.1 hypothetical protein GCM10007391_33720 [Alteromonas halophila]
MKGLMVLLVAVLVVAALWLSRDDTTPDSILRDVSDMPETQPVQTPAKAAFNVDEQKNSVDAENRQAQLTATKTQLDALMLAYNDNLSNPEKRSEIKREMDKLLREYDKLVLPVALEKMKQEDTSHGG